MTYDCAALKKLPEKELSQGDVETQWGYKDTPAYHDCRARHRALRDFYRNRDSRLTR